MIRPLSALTMSLFLLSGCLITDRQGVDLPESEWTDERIALLLNPPPPVEEPDPVPANLPIPRRKPDPAKFPTLSDVKLNIDELLGLDFKATEALLGTPALDEVQAPARVWAYNGRGCVLNIFFYPQVDGSSYQALTYEVKSSEDTADFRDRCFDELIREKEGT